MRTQELTQLNTDLQTLGFTIPKEVTKLQTYLQQLNSIQVAEGNRELQGINSVNDIEAEVDRRTDEVLRGTTKKQQINLLRDSVQRHIEIAYIDVAETIINDLKPIAVKAHTTIMEAADKLGGQVSAEAAVETKNLKAYEAANTAYDTLETARRIRQRFYTIDAPDIDRGMQRTLYTWRFAHLDALDTYQALPDAGSPIANHITTAHTDGITFAWLSTTEAEQQNTALGTAQKARDKGDDHGLVFDPEAMVYRTGAKTWMYQ